MYKSNKFVFQRTQLVGCWDDMCCFFQDNFLRIGISYFDGVGKFSGLTVGCEGQAT